MLTAEQLKPHLLSPDRFVRDAVAKYFGESWSRDTDLVPIIVQGCERFGVQANQMGLRFCDHLPLTDEAFDRVLALLARTADRNSVHHLNDVIVHAPVELLISREQAIRENPRFDQKLAPLLQQRREWAGWSGERLWEELQDFARRSKDKRYTNEVDLSYAAALVEALAPHTIPDTETLCRLLGSFSEEEGDWLEIFLVDLAGERRVHEAVPVLVRKFRIDTDYLLEESMEALAKMGDPEAVRLIRSEFPTASDTYKIFTAGVLGKIPHPESEDAILSLLETEEDVGTRTSLCHGLCQLFSERGVEVVLREIESGYESFLVNLERELLPVADVLGIELPQGDHWRKEREEQERRVAQRIAQMERESKRYEEQEARRRRAAMPPLPPPATKLVPFQSSPKRVGRNEPCPCGSGKKFKNCCLHKGG